MVIMYTDGASRGNPGPGGFGVVLKYGKHRKELTKGFRKTTNNRMELMAAISALESLTVTPVANVITPGRTQQFAAMGRYTDASFAVETLNATWESSTVAASIEMAMALV